jgi:hypothetical protein
MGRMGARPRAAERVVIVVAPSRQAVHDPARTSILPVSAAMVW